MPDNHTYWFLGQTTGDQTIDTSQSSQMSSMINPNRVLELRFSILEYILEHM